MLSRRWAVFALVVVVLAYATWWLGEWQWHRLADRKTSNAIVRTNEAAPPVPATQVLAAPGQTLDQDSEWRKVTATGTYDATGTVIIRYRDDDHGQSGVDVVVPLMTADGTAVIVDRGFLPTDATPQTPSDVPPPPSGQVSVTGYARADGDGGSTDVSSQSARAVSAVKIGQALDLRTRGGFVQAISESPAAATSLGAGGLPDLTNGPHFFYALQWWFFGVLAAFGFFYLAWDERTNGKRGDREADRTAGAVRPSQTVRTRPDSVGSA